MEKGWEEEKAGKESMSDFSCMVMKNMVSWGQQTLSLTDHKVNKKVGKIGRGATKMISMNIPVGVSDFVEIRRNGYYYIDKTALIAELLKTTGTKVTLITRPRRFGKTLGKISLIFARTAKRCFRDLRLQKTKNSATRGWISIQWSFFHSKM